MLFRQVRACARPLAWLRAGSNNPARRPMTAMTTSSSMSVKPAAAGNPIETRLRTGVHDVFDQARRQPIEALDQRGLIVSFQAHDGFDDACLGFEPVGELADHFIEPSLMRHPWAGVDPGVLDQLDDATDVGRQGVAT